MKSEKVGGVMKSEKVGGAVPKYPIVAQPRNEIVVYQPNETMRLEVALRDETVWLTQSQMAELFGCSVDNVGLHLKNVYRSGELSKAATAEESSVVRIEGSRPVTRRVIAYNLDAIISVGYRVNSKRGVQFRIWATSVLKEYMIRGMVFSRQRDALAAEMDRRLENHEKRIAAVEQKVDFVVQSALPAPEMVFMEGEFLTAHDAIRKIVKAAKRRLVLIDNYIDERVLTLLSERRKGVACHVYGKNAAKRDVQLAFSRYQQQFPNDGLTLKQWSNAHDRFIICDDTVWLCGASVKDAGRRMFALVKMSTKPDFILSELPLLSESDKRSSVRHILQ